MAVKKQEMLNQEWHRVPEWQQLLGVVVGHGNATPQLYHEQQQQRGRGRPRLNAASQQQQRGRGRPRLNAASQQQRGRGRPRLNAGSQQQVERMQMPKYTLAAFVEKYRPGLDPKGCSFLTNLG